VSRKVIAVAAILSGACAVGMLVYYITACGWLLKELLVVLGITVAAFGCGLYLAALGW